MSGLCFTLTQKREKWVGMTMGWAGQGGLEEGGDSLDSYVCSKFSMI